jgi:hypothetical protein
MINNLETNFLLHGPACKSKLAGILKIQFVFQMKIFLALFKKFFLLQRELWDLVKFSPKFIISLSEYTYA